MRELTLFESQLAEQCAARHRTPKATVTHPPGVIVPYDTLLTHNIRDPDYVPYCGNCTLCQRVRRIEEGFECPACYRKSNWDLTRFNNNVNVQFEEGFSAPIKVPPPAPQVVLQSEIEPAQRDWLADMKRKNGSYLHRCPVCVASFKGNRKRHHCFTCAPFQKV